MDKMTFLEFKQLLQQHVAGMLKDQDTLFVVDTDNDLLWDTYLDSFPEGTNQIYRERREFDCSCCRHFIRAFGNVVTIKDNRIVSIWDFMTGDSTYQPVVDALATFVRSYPIRDVFVTKEAVFGTDKSHEQLESGKVQTWEHFYIKLPAKFVTKSTATVGSIMSELRSTKNVFVRSLEEISLDAIETVLDLIAQKSLYKGEEWQGILVSFQKLHKQYHKLPKARKDAFCWQQSAAVGGALGKIRNHSIGVLLINITEGMDLDEAVRKYEAIVAPSNYKRPKAIFTQRMLEAGKQALAEKGLLDSLGRRFATLDDITVNNILFANRATARTLTKTDAFAKLAQQAVTSPKKFDRVEEVPIEHFIENILPRTTSIEALLENHHTGNLVSLIAPAVPTSKGLFKWNNNFSWAYKGNVTDSMKERVKAAGGNVEGVLRFSIQWNDDGDNQNDFDAHCIEPNRNHIYYITKGRRHLSSGMLDVDWIHPGKEVAVENIIWTNLNKMPVGQYQLFVHVYNYRGGRSGFSAEIEFDGQTHSFEYRKDVRDDERILVAVINVDAQKKITMVKSMPSTTAAKTIWGLPTGQFHKVPILMLSPNYWDGQVGVGHRHYLFMLESCINDEQPNGFFNEFLHQDLMEHKRVLEALGSEMKVAPTNNQLSGLGFSSTKRAALICKIEGHVSRMLKLIF